MKILTPEPTTAIQQQIFKVTVNYDILKIAIIMFFNEQLHPHSFVNSVLPKWNIFKYVSMT